MDMKNKKDSIIIFLVFEFLFLIREQTLESKVIIIR